MRVLIIEDEKMAADRLTTLLHAYDASTDVLAQIDSVKKAVAWLLGNPPPDLILMDIHLGDGISFEIFELASVQSPVIFVTAYNEYAIQAFKVNSVDYLLKPLDKDSLFRALDKYRNLFRQSAPQPAWNADVLRQLVESYGHSYKNRFIIKIGEHLKAVQTDEILYFFTRERGTFAQTTGQRRYLLDHTLDQVEQLVDPKQFFRINRQYLVRFEAIDDMVAYSNSRLRLLLKHADDHAEVVVSREKVNQFKAWLDR